MFPDDYVHLGGDEVDFDCWLSNPAIREWLKNRGDGQGNTPSSYKYQYLSAEHNWCLNLGSCGAYCRAQPNHPQR